MDKKVERFRSTLTLTETFVKALDQLIESGIYTEKQSAIREALRLLFYMHDIEPFRINPLELFLAPRTHEIDIILHVRKESE